MSAPDVLYHVTQRFEVRLPWLWDEMFSPLWFPAKVAEGRLVKPDNVHKQARPDPPKVPLGQSVNPA